jgi:integrase/recombinase XerD
MLKAYRRHREPRCRHKNRDYRQCSCVIWVDGTLDGKRYNKSLETRNWDVAQKKVLVLEAAGEPESSKSIKEACDAFIRDCEARGLRATSIYKYRLLFKQLKAFAEQRGFTHITECDLETLRKFRESWVNKNYSARKKLEALRTFFRFAHDSGWLPKNPALGVKPPKVDQPPTMPFSRDEFARVLAACADYPHPGHPNKYWGERLRSLVLLLRHSGLRISDGVTLSAHAVKDDILTLRTEKTGTLVRVPLPAEVIQALDGVKQPNGYYFWSGASTKKSCVGNYQRACKKLYKLAGVKHGHAHRWRDTAAVEWLLGGVSLAEVSVLLGHQSTKVTERHYRPWVLEFQKQLEDSVRRSFLRLRTDHPETATYDHQ